MPQIYSEVYKGVTITAKATSNTGTMPSKLGKVATHTIIVKRNDDVAVSDDMVVDSKLAATVLDLLQRVRDEIDRKSEFDRILEELGFTSQTTAPAEFDVYQAGPGDPLLIKWTFDEAASYTLQVATLANYSDATTIASGTIDSHTQSFAPGTYYFRVKAAIADMEDSAWTQAMKVVL